MTRTEIIAKLQPVFDEVFLAPPVLTPALSAKDVPEWDSLIHIPLILAVEAAFGIRFRVGEVEATKNIGEFADLIGRRLSGG
jgi:acyl carrier protein